MEELNSLIDTFPTVRTTDLRDELGSVVQQIPNPGSESELTQIYDSRLPNRRQTDSKRESN